MGEHNSLEHDLKELEKEFNQPKESNGMFSFFILLIDGIGKLSFPKLTVVCLTVILMFSLINPTNVHSLLQGRNDTTEYETVLVDEDGDVKVLKVLKSK